MQLIGAPELRAAVLGPAMADGDAVAGRTNFYAEVMGLQPAVVGGVQVLDLGPGSAEAEALAQAVMGRFGQLSAGVVRRRLGSLRMEAASRVRAANGPGSVLRLATGQVAVAAVRPGHAGFFGLDVLTLCHTRFEGGMSEEVRREVFVSADAVTVLPYDPGRDRVLLVEQFRVGPLGRGDPLPWQLEAVAGRIDPGESPEDCARREAAEEAGLTLGQLLKVGEYYPSPGAMTEYIYSYVGICDLPDGVAGVFGQPDEAEDIRGHLLSFDAFMAAVAGGEIANAPLLLTALWLQRERGRLRG